MPDRGEVHEPDLSGLRSIATQAARQARGLPADEVRARGTRRRHRRIAGTSAAAGLTAAVLVGVAMNFGGDLLRTEVQPVAPSTTQPTEAVPGMDATVLLPGEEIATPSRLVAWKAVGTYPGEGSSPVSICQRGTLLGLGATQVWRREYRVTPRSAGSPGPPAGTMTLAVAQFDDPVSARSAYDQIRGWIDSCETVGPNNVEADKINVEGAGAVDIGTGEGIQQMVTYRPVPGDPYLAYLDQHGLAVTGDRLVLFSQITVGQDWQSEPSIRTLQRAAERATG